MYKISITEITEKNVTRKDWKKVRDVPESLKTKSKYYEDKENEISEYAYVPYDTTEKVEKTILEQEVAEIDIKAVIKAVNGI